MKDYPKKLLSKENYKYIDLKDLNESSLLLRTISTNNIQDILIDSSENKINFDIILPIDNYHQVFGLSVNLFGLFNIEDINFKVTNKDLNEYWHENECEIVINKNDYNVLENMGAIFLDYFL